MRSNRAFTLIEVLLVVAIAGIVITAGITPLIFTVRTLAVTRENFAKENRERSVFNRIALDMREIVTLNSTSPVRITQSEELALGPRDCLILWTKTPTYTGLPLGNVIYAIPPRTVLSDNFEDGLYRWVTSEDIDLSAESSGIKELLDPEKGALILPGLTGVTFKMLDNKEWRTPYTGAMPQAMMTIFEYEDRERTYEITLPKG